MGFEVCLGSLRQGELRASSSCCSPLARRVLKVLCRVLGFQWEKAALGVTLVVYLAVVRVAELQRQVHFFGGGKEKVQSGMGRSGPLRLSPGSLSAPEGRLC